MKIIKLHNIEKEDSRIPVGKAMNNFLGLEMENCINQEGKGIKKAPVWELFYLFNYSGILKTAPVAAEVTRAA